MQQCAAKTEILLQLNITTYLKYYPKWLLLLAYNLIIILVYSYNKKIIKHLTLSTFEIQIDQSATLRVVTCEARGAGRHRLGVALSGRLRFTLHQLSRNSARTRNADNPHPQTLRENQIEITMIPTRLRRFITPLHLIRM